MIKDIVVNLPVGGAADVATPFAVSIAAELAAHLTGIAFRCEPVIPAMVDMYGIPPAIIASQRAEIEEAAKTAVADFEEAVSRAAVSGQAHIVDAPVDGAPGMLASIARRFDLSVLAQPQPGEPALARLFVEAALFESGRPVLIVPYIQTAGLKLERVLVGWDGSRNAARAIGDAMPLLVQAKATEIVMVAGEPAKSDELPGAEIAHHLARHGIKVEVERIPATDVDIASTILSHAADVSADFLVMGGYGHSRMREFMLGGATRGILGSMTIPTLMSH
jgi:nucleotide-binding universal stress UspA family protein